MNASELTDKWKKREIKGLAVDSVMNVNHKPHPFMIGTRHVAHASDHHCGSLGNETLKAIPCAMRGCGLPYEQHTSDRVMFLELTKNMKRSDVAYELSEIKDEVEADGIDGFAFIKNEFELEELEG